MSVELTSALTMKKSMTKLATRGLLNINSYLNGKNTNK